MKRAVAAVLVAVVVLGLIVGLLWYLGQRDLQDYNLQEKAHMVEKYYGGALILRVIIVTGGWNEESGMYEYEFLCEARQGRYKLEYADVVDLSLETIGKLKRVSQ